MASHALLTKAGITFLSDERTQKAAGWTLVAILSPLILLVAFFCALGSGTAEHNISAVELCFYGGTLPESTPEEYRVCINQMQDKLSQLDSALSTINGQAEGKSLDDIRVKAIFYALYFGAENQPEAQWFADCFVTYEERTRTVTVTNEDGTTSEAEETYTVAIPIEDLEQVYQNLRSALGAEATPEQQGNADSIYSLIRYGYVSNSGGGGIIEGGDIPFIGADGFCSPIGADWRKKVTSEFGGRISPITGKWDGHTGIDLAVPTGTPVRAALPGTVTGAKYHYSYGYYVKIDHGNGLSTLYAHNSKLLVQAGQTVQAGDVISLSGSTGDSTGPHVHFEVWVNGQRTNPRSYLP